jgi:putative PepSY-like beta-lactamase-inhibitor
MIASRLWCVAGGLFAAVLAGLLLALPAASAQDKKKDSLDLDRIPKVVMQALKAKFPKAEIHKWTKEKEGDDVIYDIEFKQEGRKCEADIKEKGDYINYEKAIEAKDLPKAVRDAIEKRYPKATLKENMEETEVKGKDEKLSAYEVVLTTAEKKEVEVRVSPNGKILEDTGEKKEEAGEQKEKKS